MVLYKEDVLGLEIGVDEIEVMQDCTQGSDTQIGARSGWKQAYRQRS